MIGKDQGCPHDGLSKHRATIRRTVSTGQEDPYGGAITSVVDLPGMPCYVQEQRQENVTDEGKFIAVGTHVLMARGNVDLLIEDVLTGVYSIGGKELFEGLYRIEGLIRYYRKHLEATLEKYG